jgi:hypothetical protein
MTAIKQSIPTRNILRSSVLRPFVLRRDRYRHGVPAEASSDVLLRRPRLPTLRLLEDVPPVLLGEPVQQIQVSAVGTPERPSAAFGGDRLAILDLARPAAIAALSHLSHLLG